MSKLAKVIWNRQNLDRIKQRFVEGAWDLATTLATECRDKNPGAPVLSGNLKASIRTQPTNTGIEIIAGGRTNGVNVAYALRQELENPNGHQGYMRKPFERMFGNDNWKQKFFGRLMR